MNANQRKLRKADIRSVCPHVLDATDPSETYGRVWEENGAVVVCEPCYGEIKAAIVGHLIRGGKTRVQAEQFFAEHSLRAGVK